MKPLGWGWGDGKGPLEGGGGALEGGRWPTAIGKGSTCSWEGGYVLAKVRKLVVSHR